VVLEAATGRDALRQAQALPDLIVLDVQLPDVDGGEVARLLKADPRTARIPILHLTGTFREVGDKVRALETAEGYLTKPVEAAELTATVRALLRARRAEVRLRASETRRRVAEALVVVGAAITAPLALRTVLGLVAEQAGALLGTERTAVALVDPGAPTARGGLQVAAHRGMGAQLGYEGIATHAMAQGSPVWSPDLHQDRAFALTAEARTTLLTEGVRAVLAVPLRVEQRILGALVVCRTAAGPFASDEVKLLEAFGAQVAIAIEHARLHEESQARQARLEALLDVSRQLVRIQPLPELLQAIVAACGQVLAADGVDVRLVEGDELVPSGAWGDAAPAPGAARPGHDDSLCGWVAAHRTPLVVAEPASDARLRPEHQAVFRQRGTRAWLGVPVIAGDRLEGVLAIHTRRPGGFTEADGATATAFAAHAGTALENARLYQAIRESHETLTRTQAQLTQAQKMEAIGQLAGGVAHDFNNLVTVIQGRSEVLLNTHGSDPHLVKQTQAIQTAAERAATLTRQLLAFSRKQVLAPRVLDLAALVAGMEEMLRRLIREDIAFGTVHASERGRVRADPGQIEQVVMNLVINARDAMPQGGQLRLETAAADLDETFVRDNPGAQRGAFVKLAVCDTGIGMDAETQARCFEPFFTTKAPGHGTGLGLAMVYGIVKQHQGYVRVESALGRGTTVTVYLPRLSAQTVLDRPAPKSDAAPRGSETVLLVEDQPDVRAVTREMLESLGYTVLATGQPAEAVQLVEGAPHPVRLLVTDVVMPDVSGPELTRQLAARWPGLRVLYVSGYTDDAIVHHGVLEPGVILLAKPFTRATLAQRVREALAEAPGAVAPNGSSV
jgi:signal transduction histidine kinase/DNA-binding response OmpR family regulator